MTAIDYITGLFTYSFDNNNLRSAFIKRGVADDADYEDATTKQLELIQADLFMVMYTVFSEGTQSKSMGGWSESEGGYQVTVNDRKAWRTTANKIYAKYDTSISLTETW